MSEVSALARRLPMIATGFAVVAVVVAGVAAFKVLDGREPAKAAAAVVSDSNDRSVDARDVVKLSGSTVEMVVDAGVTRGARVSDEALAKSLGLTTSDVITGISGRAITREYDFHDIVFNTSMMRATTLYVEIERDKQPVLVRWKVNGDLRSARYGIDLTRPWPSYSSSTSSLFTSDPDPLLDTITKIDDTHFELPRATVDGLLADPAKYARSARVVPSMSYGVANGIKLYAIRPSSVFSRLGLTNGDNVQSINGHEISSPDKLLEVWNEVKSASELTIEVTRRGRAVTLAYSIK